MTVLDMPAEVLDRPVQAASMLILRQCVVCSGWFRPDQLASGECAPCTWAEERRWARRADR